MILWLLPAAFAQDAAAPVTSGEAHLPVVRTWSAWAETGLESAPTTKGETEIRFREDLGVDIQPADGAGGWGLYGVGALRRTGIGDVEGSLYRMSAHGTVSDVDVQVGRVVRLGVAGYEPIDGVHARWDEDKPVTLTAWAGRLWDTEAWKVDDHFVGGVEATWRPLDVHGEPSRIYAGTASYEARLVEGALVNRVGAGAVMRNPLGEALFANAEVEVPLAGDPALRGEAHGRTWLSRTTVLGGELRWEGLSPQSETVRDPTDWLGKGAYGLALVTLDRFDGRFDIRASGGPVYHLGNGGDYGAQARASAALTNRAGTGVGLFGGGTTLGTSHAWGGGAEARWNTESIKLRSEAALWDVSLLDGADALVWEARLSAAARISPRVDVGALAGAGADRVLAPWYQGGATLTVHLDGEVRQ